MKEVYAKSKNYTGAQLTLLQHSMDVEQAAILIFDEKENFFKQYCSFFNFNEEEEKHFLLNLRIASLFHDIGKANEDFQNMIAQNSTVEKSQTQCMRHEHFSLLIMSACDFHNFSHPGLKNYEIFSAVGSHHLKLSEKSNDYKMFNMRKMLPVNFFPDKINSILFKINKILNSNFSFSLNKINFQEFESLANPVRKIARKIKNSNFLSALKAAVIFCDSIASIVKSKSLSNEEMEEWVKNIFRKDKLDKSFIYDNIINTYTDNVLNFKWHPFQLEVDGLGDRNLLIAGCGFGKTLAAWRWVANQADVCQKENVIFLLPTRGTATEIYKSYVSPAPTVDKILKHGTALYSMLRIEDCPDNYKNEKEFELKERYDSLQVYKNKIFTATVDQFLSFLSNDYGSIICLPLLVNSIVVIDEVHAFDDKMFGLLIDFLKKYKLPVLCMSATITQDRLEKLRKVGLQLHEGKDEIKENLDKYNIKYCDSFEKIDIQEISDHEKVLIVVNTVKQCQSLANKLHSFKDKGYEIICYHSRFKLSDKESIHRKVIDNFRKPGKLIVVCTQVCEMSLDIDCSLLITQVAPWSSLIQRFGRCNRQNKLDKGQIRTYNGDIEGNTNPIPYSKSEINFSIGLLKSRDFKTQKELAEALSEQIDEEVSNSILEEKQFAKQRFYATSGSFRDSSDISIPCIISSDLDEVKNLIAYKLSIDGYIIGVSENNLNKIKTDKFNNFYVIDKSYYDSIIGLQIG